MSARRRVSAAQRVCIAATATIALAGLLVTPAIAPATASAGGSPAATANSWAPTGPMQVARSGQTATALPDGAVLVAGGGTAAADLYDVQTGTFSPTGRMSTPRTDATATLLPSGLVLVAGGRHGGQLASAELYDPGTGTWSPTGSMLTARSSDTATLLPDGEVLVAGGGCNGHHYGCDGGSFLVALKSAELYDPTTGTWRKTGGMAVGRESFTATLLGDGNVLAAGGFHSCDDSFCTDVASAEVYDPATGQWSPTRHLLAAREQATATLLPGGAVLVAGGLRLDPNGGRSTELTEAELYDPSSGRWSRTASMAEPHAGGTATELTNGWVLVTGGATAASEIFEPHIDSWVSPDAMSTVRTDGTATLLADGHVLVTGGGDRAGQPQATAEVFLAGKGPLVTFTPAALSFGGQQVGSRSSAASFAVTNSGSGPLKVTGVALSGAHPGDYRASTTCAGSSVPPLGTCTVSVIFAPSGTGLRSARLAVYDNAPHSPQAAGISGYGAGPNVWVPTGSMSGGRDESTATRLTDGDVLVAGGEDGPLHAIGTAELYDPATKVFTPTGSLNVSRAYAAATRLRDGDVLVAGGIGGPNESQLSSAELYDARTGAWTMTSDMNAVGYALTSTLLPSGKVLVTGISGDQAEVYDPTTGAWTDTQPMVGSGFFGTATLLHNGLVLVAGGGSAVAGLYHPATNGWTATGSATVARMRPTATLLPDGSVLLAGGAVPNGGPPLASAEIYHPTTGSWTATTGPMNVPREGDTATLLPDGFVLVAGGCSVTCNERGSVTASSEIFVPSSGYWFPTASMTQPRFAATATVLPGGALLVVGGSSYCCHFVDTAEQYHAPLLALDPASGPVGTQVKIRGSGFYAFEKVEILWDSMPLATPRTSRRGTFTSEVTVPAASLGVHTLLATGQRSFGRVQAIFRVTGS